MYRVKLVVNQHDLGNPEEMPGIPAMMRPTLDTALSVGRVMLRQWVHGNYCVDLFDTSLLQEFREDKTNGRVLNFNAREIARATIIIIEE